MNTENFEELKKTLKYLGFGELMNDALGKALDSGKQQFTLNTRMSYGLPISIPEDPKTMDRVHYDLTFKQGKNGVTYFNNYVAKLESPLLNERQQTFYVDKGRTFTAKESYNLLSGRSVYKALENKEGERYRAFVQLDFKGEQKPNGNYPLKSYHEKFGFNLQEKVSQLPIRFSSLEERDRIIRGLERGNLQKIQLQDGRTAYAQTLPSDKSLRLYDEKLQSVVVGKEKALEQKSERGSGTMAPKPLTPEETSPDIKNSGSRRKASRA